MLINQITMLLLFIFTLTLFREVNKTFIIKSVIDPRDNSEISLQQAIMVGIINPETGYYINPDTEESKLIPTAMNEGLIKVGSSE